MAFHPVRMKTALFPRASFTGLCDIELNYIITRAQAAGTERVGTITADRAEQATQLAEAAVSVFVGREPTRGEPAAPTSGLLCPRRRWVWL